MPRKPTSDETIDPTITDPTPPSPRNASSAQ